MWYVSLNCPRVEEASSAAPRRGQAGGGHLLVPFLLRLPGYYTVPKNPSNFELFINLLGMQQMQPNIYVGTFLGIFQVSPLFY